MLCHIQNVKPVRLAVLSYDITSARRARAVRKVLDAVYHCKQYSVYETLLTRNALLGVLSELTTCCDVRVDRLAVWWPSLGLRLGWRRNRLQILARNGTEHCVPIPLPANIGNFVVCYDISDPDTLHDVGAFVAAEAAMVQRSVYWLRAPVGQLCALLARCAPLLADDDRLWVYPLDGSRQLWHVGAEQSAILPISTYRWS